MAEEHTRSHDQGLYQAVHKVFAGQGEEGAVYCDDEAVGGRERRGAYVETVIMIISAEPSVCLG